MKSITVEEALQLILEHTPILNEEQMPLLKALGQRLTQNICAEHPQPPFDRSPLDGYALRAADIAQASADAPVTLEVVDKLYAGDVSSVPRSAGTSRPPDDRQHDSGGSRLCDPAGGHRRG